MRERFVAEELSEMIFANSADEISIRTQLSQRIRYIAAHPTARPSYLPFKGPPVCLESKNTYLLQRVQLQ